MEDHNHMHARDHHRHDQEEPEYEDEFEEKQSHQSQPRTSPPARSRTVRPAQTPPSFQKQKTPNPNLEDHEHLYARDHHTHPNQGIRVPRQAPDQDLEDRLDHFRHPDRQASPKPHQHANLPAGESLDDLKNRLAQDTVYLSKQPSSRLKNFSSQAHSDVTHRSKNNQSIPQTPIPRPEPRQAQGNINPPQKTMSARSVGGVAPAPTKPTPPSMPPSVNIGNLNSSSQLQSIDLNSLRSGEFENNLQSLYRLIFQLAKQENNLPYTIWKKFEASPVNKIFSQQGLLLIDSDSGGQDGFESARAKLERSLGASMSREEFDTFLEFKEQVENLF